MRLACGFAIAFCLSLAVPGVARPQDQTGSANVAPQVPAAPAPAETVTPVPANPQNPAEQKAPENIPKKKNAGPVSRTSSATRKRCKRPSSSVAAPSDPPRKIVVREGGAREPAAQIEPDITPAEAKRDRQDAEKLLDSSDVQLKHLAGRTLNPQQQETVGQIHNYMDGARSALKEGDVRRAGTLAQKAYLLADDLVKH
jgi:hypothetical protein